MSKFLAWAWLIVAFMWSANLTLILTETIEISKFSFVLALIQLIVTSFLLSATNFLEANNQ